MSASDPNSVPITSGRQRARKFRIAGTVMVLLGLTAAGLVYGLETHSDEAADALTNGDSKIEVRQVETMYGTQGLLIQDLNNQLKLPGTQAILILTATGLAAAVCFFVARVESRRDENG